MNNNYKNDMYLVLDMLDNINMLLDEITIKHILNS